jgi:hypothetical protein
MTRLIQIDSDPALAPSDLLAALDRQGVVGTITPGPRPSDGGGVRVTLRVERAIVDLASRIQHALDDAIARYGVPLLSEQIDEDRFVVRPPAG